MVGIFSLVTGRPGPSGFGSASTAEQVTEGIDASNITCIITGGASGIGLETARVLALRKAHVIIAARNMESAKEAKQLILQENEFARVETMKLDLSSLKSVRSFAENFIARDLPLNILINNAGVMFCPYQRSEDGIEMQFATNYLGHFLLTNLLLEKMKESTKASGIEGRIINLSSIAHSYTYEEGIRFDNLNDEVGYSDKRAYGQSKLANILHANELSRRLKIFLKMFTFFIWKNVPQGAATTCYVALHPNLKGMSGKYFLDCNEFKPSAYASNELLGRKLWDFSNKLINSISKA